jgi:hypothetical protein
MAFSGSCHCGAVEFIVDADPPTEAYACNCSHCERKGFLLHFYPAASVVLARGEEALKSYFFNKHAIEHRFCAHCGTQPLAEGKDREGNATRMVNLRCVDAIDIASLEVKKVDGRSF